MFKNIISAMLICSGTLTPSVVFAHGGGLDSSGCHHDHQDGGYHCHNGGSTGGDDLDDAGKVFLGILLLGALASGMNNQPAPVQQHVPAGYPNCGIVEHADYEYYYVHVVLVDTCTGEVIDSRTYKR